MSSNHTQLDPLEAVKQFEEKCYTCRYIPKFVENI